MTVWVKECGANFTKGTIELWLKDGVNELSVFCAENNINLIIVVTPVSKYYLKELYPGYKDIFYEVLGETDGVIHLLDLAADETYADEDFNDMDHLGDSGAKKLTQGILELVNDL